MNALNHMRLALKQMEMAESTIKPGDLPDVASANLHTSLFYLMAAIDAADNRSREFPEVEVAAK